MQFKSIVLSFALLAAVCVVSAQNGPIVDGLVAQIKAQMDVNANPCQDFYQYACGKFLKENPIPKNASKNVPYLNWPAFDAVQDHVDKLLLEMVKQPWPYVNDFFLSCNQPASVYEQSFNATFREVFNNLEHADVSSITARMDLIFNLTKHQSAFLVIFPSDYFVMGVNPVGSTLPYPDYVQKGDAYKQLLAEITQVFSKFENISQASKHAQEIVNIEEYVAKASYVAGQDYFITTIANATEQTKIDFEAYLAQYGLNVTGRSQLSFATGSFYYFRNLTRFVASIPDSTLRRYLQWQTYTELKTFNSTQRAWSKNPAKQEAACAQLTDQFLSDLVGMIFVEEVITDDIITSIRNMTIGIQNAFNGSLDALSWLDKQGLAAVRFKLQNIIQIIGHPNRIEKFSNLMTSTTNLFRNILNVQVVEFTYLLQSAYIPFNRSDDVFDPLIVNAFYNPLANTIDFPAAILESPIFSASWPKLFQYARLGYIVGHENTHGFDNEGSHFNAFGEEIDIFDKITRQKYDNSSKCIVDVYDKFIAYGNQTVNGTNTLGENIADIGGVKNSFRAYQNYVMKSGKEFLDGTLVPGLSTEQVFFLIFAQTTCAVTNEAWEEYIFENDVHAPNRYRTNGPISQSDAFAKAYSCPVGSPMNPAKKCNLW